MAGLTHEKEWMDGEDVDGDDWGVDKDLCDHDDVDGEIWEDQEDQKAEEVDAHGEGEDDWFDNTEDVDGEDFFDRNEDVDGDRIWEVEEDAKAWVDEGETEWIDDGEDAWLGVGETDGGRVGANDRSLGNSDSPRTVGSSGDIGVNTLGVSAVGGKNESREKPYHPGPVVDEDQYAVEAIVEHRMEEGKLLYRIRWLGYEEEFDTWEPPENINEDFLAAYNASTR